MIVAQRIIEEAKRKMAECKKKDPTPEIIDHCAAAVVKRFGYHKRKAYQICVGAYQRYGILKKDSMKLTEKGKKMSQKHYGKPRQIDLKKVPE